MKDDIAYRIIEKLDTIVKLCAITALKDLSFNEQVMTLSEMGMPPKEIAVILAKTPNHIRVALSTLKKRKSKKVRKKTSLQGGKYGQ